jgi:two-component system response regulator PilR (NtrC family)
VARILVVDDEPDVRELFNITLKMAGHTTETAKDGMEAVDMLASDSPDLILLDLMMPRLDGFGLLEHIRKEMDGRPVRVLIATAKVLEEQDQQKLNSWPVVGVLNKGELDIGQMVGIISTALASNPNKTSSAAPSPTPSAASGKAPTARPAPTSPAPNAVSDKAPSVPPDAASPSKTPDTTPTAAPGTTPDKTPSAGPAKTSETGVDKTPGVGPAKAPETSTDKTPGAASGKNGN